MNLTGLVFSTRNNTITTATATVYISTDCGATFTPTTLAATVTSPACFNVASGSIPVTVGTLITVGLDIGMGALADGAAATILFSIP
ncbi:hypothetical protein BAOM_0281 [Peribacillus asahii]|uniref:Uncharacterized protein n=2 Tax=Peribacillus asahii TaxID=228899 RepID=A0A3Q9RJW8_9BACI|nr:hypothetical protein [Peribacillus asahii]AZV40969.1 hypothetical protein BAOM_0281 [Peribacillus asahii]